MTWYGNRYWIQSDFASYLRVLIVVFITTFLYFSDKDATTLPTPMQEINAALKECAFGWFHIKLLMSSFFAMLGGTFITNTTPYILPNAECDLNMDLLQKGIINAVPFVGKFIVFTLFQQKKHYLFLRSYHGIYCKRNSSFVILIAAPSSTKTLVKAIIWMFGFILHHSINSTYMLCLPQK